MPGIGNTAIDPRIGARNKTYYHNAPPALAIQADQLFGISQSWAGANGVGIVRLKNPAGYGIIQRGGHYNGEAAKANSDFSFLLKVLRGRAWTTGEGAGLLIPLQPAVTPVVANNPIATITLATLAPLSEDPGDLDGVLTDSGGADEDTLDTVAGNPALANYHVGNQLRRLDTMEVATISAYTAGRVATHPAWTLGTADAPTGTPYRLKHNNRIVKDGDLFAVTTTAVGAAPPTLGAFFIDVLEAGMSGNNRQ